MKQNALAALLDIQSRGGTTLSETVSMGGLAQLHEAGLVERLPGEDNPNYILTDSGKQTLTEYHANVPEK